MRPASATEAALHDATAMLDALIYAHRAAAIPAAIAACVAWAVENGAADLVKGSLSRAITLADEAAKIHQRSAQ